MSESRTHNLLKNFGISLIIQVITLLATFISRTVFIHILNADYLGLNGLFTNILTLISFAELGLGSAIIYTLYKPASINDEDSINRLLFFYKKTYRRIFLVVFFSGVLVMPFLYVIVKTPPNVTENIYIIYFLFLLNTSSSYLFSYRKALMSAMQKEYITVFIQQISRFVQLIIQIVILFFYQDYYLFLIIQIIFTLTGNYLLHIKCGTLYPFVKKKSNSEISESTKKDLFLNIKAIFFYKLGSVFLKATDNIIITQILNITVVGVYSNYILITATIESVLAKALNSIVGVIGNLNASQTMQKERRLDIFNQLYFVSCWIYGFISVCLVNLINPFIELWAGKSYLLDYNVVVVIIVNFYIFGINFVPSTFRVTFGDFRRAKYVPLFASIINIFCSVIGGLKFGLIGIFISTAIARVFTFGIIDPFLVVKKRLDGSLFSFYSAQFKYLMVTLLNAYACSILLSYISLSGVFGFFLEILLVMLLSTFLYVVIYYRTREFKSLRHNIKTHFKAKNQNGK